MKNKTNLLALDSRTLCVVATLLCSLVIWLVSGRPAMVARANHGTYMASVSPTGWRRTVSGWERAEEWRKPAAKAQLDINQWLAIQDQRESAIARGLLGQLRSVHPLCISMTLLGAVIAIVLLNERRATELNSAVPPLRR